MHTTGGALSIERVEDDSVLETVEAFSDPDTQVMAFQMDEAMVYVNKQHITRIEVE